MHRACGVRVAEHVVAEQREARRIGPTPIHFGANKPARRRRRGRGCNVAEIGNNGRVRPSHKILRQVLNRIQGHIQCIKKKKLTKVRRHKGDCVRAQIQGSKRRQFPPAHAQLLNLVRRQVQALQGA
eukprot:Amastigsp_a842418_168.p2 type:complete len:127 gc:universal Amastigsp_a842418_168:949-1329(+)